MKNSRLDAAQVWKNFEDLLAPKLNFSVNDRAVYSHLLRHSSLEGKLRIRFSLSWLAPHIRLSVKTARQSVRRLIAWGVLRLVERSCKSQHLVCVRLPHEVPAVHAASNAARGSAQPSWANGFAELEFLQSQVHRRAIHEREGGRCFYCLRRLIRQRRCIDHVIPVAKLGTNSYRNLVSCCLDCNTLKADRDAVEFVRSLYRDRRLSSDELTGRLRALDDLARRPAYSTTS